MALFLYRLKPKDGSAEWFGSFLDARHARKAKRVAHPAAPISLERVTFKKFAKQGELALAVLSGDEGKYVEAVEELLYAHAP